MLVNGISDFMLHQDFSWLIIFVTPITILFKMYRRCVEKVEVDHSWESLRNNQRQGWGGYFFYFTSWTKGRKGGMQNFTTFPVYRD